MRLIEAGDFTAYPDALRFIIAVKDAGIRVAAASSPGNAKLLLRKIRLDTFAREQGITSASLRPGLTLLDFFDADVSGRDFAHGKPDPEMFLTAARELGVAPEHAMVMGGRRRWRGGRQGRRYGRDRDRAGRRRGPAGRGRDRHRGHDARPGGFDRDVLVLGHDVDDLPGEATDIDCHRLAVDGHGALLAVELPADHRQDAHAEIAEAPSSLPGQV